MCVCVILVLDCRQIALADLVLVNKVDLVSPEELKKVSETIRYV